MTIRAADDPSIADRLAQLRAERDVMNAAMDRGCHELPDGQKCAWSNCPICRPEVWAPPAPSAAPACVAAAAIAADLGRAPCRSATLLRHGIRVHRPARAAR